MIKMKVSRKQLAIVALAAVAIVTIYFIGTWITGRATEINPDASKLDALARCLTQKGVVMYGSKYCSHCTEQKKMFGESFQYVTYVECTEQQSACQANGVQYVPAWKINGQLQVGTKSLEELADLADCPFE